MLHVDYDPKYAPDGPLSWDSKTQTLVEHAKRDRTSEKAAVRRSHTLRSVVKTLVNLVKKESDDSVVLELESALHHARRAYALTGRILEERDE